MKKLTPFVLLLIIVATACQKDTLIVNRGFIHGTTYSIKYYSPAGEDLQPLIEAEMRKVDTAWSTYLESSIVSRINRNDSNVILTPYFEEVFHKALEISQITEGAFDITVAPLVNAWGFGFEKMEHVDSNVIDSLLQFVDFQKVKIKNNKVAKAFPEMMLDASAIAKGFSVDVVARFLDSKDIRSYLIEIGGELRAKGRKTNGEKWKVGIDKPVDDSIPETREFQDILLLENTALATSGNYRQFYIKNGKKYAHTIDPRTGYPVEHSLLSASVLAKECIKSDAYATAFLVMGLEKSIEIVESDSTLEAYFIYVQDSNQYQIYMTEKVEDMIY